MKDEMGDKYSTHEMRNHCGTFIGKNSKERPIIKIRLDRRIILKTDSASPRWCPMTDFSERNEPWGSIKVDNFFTGQVTINFSRQVLYHGVNRLQSKSQTASFFFHCYSQLRNIVMRQDTVKPLLP